MTVIARAAQQVKSLVLPGLGGSGAARWSFSWGGTQGVSGERGYGDLVGDGSGSSLVVACIGLIAAAFPEAPVVVRTVPADGSVPEVLAKHPMYRLMRQPLWDPKLRRSWYSQSTLTAAVLASWWLDGNAYEVKVRGLVPDAMGDLTLPVQRWYVPHWMMEPRWPENGTQFISHYDYTPDGREAIQIPVENVIHHRQGQDKDNLRKGYSPLKSVLREIYSDEQAARFTAAILHNLGVPGLMLSPAKDSKRALTPNEARLIKADVEQKTTGDRRGETLVFTDPTEIKQFGFSPNDLNLSNIRNVPEERIAAVMRVPAMVAGFGAGLEGVKVGATAAQLREQLWESNLLPTMRTFAEDYQGQLLPDFVNDATLETQEVAFDLRHVGALQELELKRADRWAKLVGGAIAQRYEARAALGLPYTDEDRIYLPQGLNAPPPGTGDPEPKPVEDEDGDEVRALTEEVGKMRSQIAITTAKMGDGRPDPNVLRLIESSDRRAEDRTDAQLKGILAVAAALRPAPEPQVVEISREIERDEKGRALRAVPVYGPYVPSAGHNGHKENSGAD